MGCGTVSPVETTRVVNNLPAIELLAPCVEPVPGEARTNAALATYVGDLRASLRSCNTDKAALRLWYDTLVKP
jgi:hypothetical protein